MEKICTVVLTHSQFEKLMQHMQTPFFDLFVVLFKNMNNGLLLDCLFGKKCHGHTAPEG